MGQKKVQKVNYDVHNRKTYFKASQARMQKNPNICEENKRLILEYEAYLAKNGKTIPTRYSRMWRLQKLAELFGKNFREVTKEDIGRVILELEGKDYKPRTMQAWKVILKTFFAWLYGCRRKQYPELVNDITTTLPKSQLQAKYGVGDILSREEAVRLASQGNNLRDRAMPLVLYESGARAGEFVTMKIENVTPDHKNNCVWVTLFGKTGERTIPLYWSKAALLRWLEVHPFSDNKKAPLWVGRLKRTEGRQLAYRTMKHQLKVMGQQAEIKKPINPHLFRHSRATECAESGWNESDMRIFFGWGNDSKMPSTYIHRSKKSVLRKVMEENNVPLPEEEKRREAPTLCMECGAANHKDVMLCCACSSVMPQKRLVQAAEERPGTKEEDINDLVEKRARELLKKLQEEQLQKWA